MSGGDDPAIAYPGSNADHTVAEYLYADRLGSIVASFNRSGGLETINAYDEFGMPGSAGGAQNSGRFRYTGQIYIPEIGLYHYKARAYSPGLGRFMQTDPIGYGDGLNMYGYVGNDPVNRFDPLGLDYCQLNDGPSTEEECKEHGGTWIKEITVLGDRGINGFSVGGDISGLGGFSGGGRGGGVFGPGAIIVSGARARQRRQVGGSPARPQSVGDVLCYLVGLLGDTRRLRAGGDAALGVGPAAAVTAGVSLRGDASLEFDLGATWGIGIAAFAGAGVGVDTAGSTDHGFNAGFGFGARGGFGVGPAAFSGSLQAHPYTTSGNPAGSASGAIAAGPKVGFFGGAYAVAGFDAGLSFRTPGLCP